MSDSQIQGLSPDSPSFALLRDELGYVPGIYRARSAAPLLLEAEAGMLRALLFADGALSRLQKEQILLVVAAVERNRYSLAAQYQTLKLMGMSEGRIAQMLADPSHPQLPPLLVFVYKLVGRRGIASREVHDLVQQGLTGAAVLEAVLTAAVGSFLNTVATGLGVAPDFKHEPDFPCGCPFIEDTAPPDSADWSPSLSAAPLPDETADLIRDTFGSIPNLLSAQSACPRIVLAEVTLIRAILLSGSLRSRIFKEQILAAVAAREGNSYGVALHHERLARLGVTSDASVPLNTQEKSALQFALRLSESPAPTAQPALDGLRDAGLTDEQIIETVAVTALGRFLNLVQRGLGAAPDFALPASYEAFLKKPYLSTSESRQSPRAAVTEDPDAVLVEEANSGNLDAFEELVTKHSQRVYRTLIGILGNADEARDAMQDTFLKAFEHLGSFQQRAKFSTWLVSIASNTAIERLRERRPVESLDYENMEAEQRFRPRQVQSWTANPEQLYSKAEMRKLVEARIMALPAKYRVVLLLRDLEELSTAEAAAALGLGVTALKARLLRGRLMLREALAPYFAVTQKGTWS